MSISMCAYVYVYIDKCMYTYIYMYEYIRNYVFIHVGDIVGSIRCKGLYRDKKEELSSLGFNYEVKNDDDNIYLKKLYYFLSSVFYYH
jgi:hypothetical protein